MMKSVRIWCVRVVSDASGRRWYPLPDLLGLVGGIVRNALFTITEFSLILF